MTGATIRIPYLHYIFVGTVAFWIVLITLTHMKIMTTMTTTTTTTATTTLWEENNPVLQMMKDYTKKHPSTNIHRRKALSDRKIQSENDQDDVVVNPKNQTTSRLFQDDRHGQSRQPPELQLIYNAIGNVTERTKQNRTQSCKVYYSYDDIVRCVPPERRKPMVGSCVNRSIETWKDVQECINGPMQPKPVAETSALRVHLIGERNSGTKWMVDEMKRCFPRDKYGLVIQRDLWSRNKHFFQTVRGRYSFQQSHIVIAAFREPTEWVAAMIEKPYHMSEHMKGFDDSGVPIPLPWEEFVRKPWTMKNRSKTDYKLMAERKKYPNKFLPCRTGMEFHEVIPCRFDPGTVPQHLVRTQNPVYELKRGGSNDEPYGSILELRSDKIVNFLLEVPLLQDLGGYLAVRFEDLLRNGTATFLQQVGEMIGIPQLPPECQPQGPRPEMIGRRKIPDGLRQWVEDHLVLSTERLLGYR